MSTLSKPTIQEWFEQIQLVILTLLACLGLLYLIPKVIVLNIGRHEHFDFIYMWLAGKAWVSGHNPYIATAFPIEYTNGGQLSPWFYPPYWYPLIAPFGLLSFHTALNIWKAFNFLLLIGATHLSARAIADLARKRYMPIFLASMAFVCLMFSTAVTVWSGQTSILVYFGLAAMLYGLLKERTGTIIVGLVFLALKPQIGMVAFAGVFALHRHRWAVILASILCILSSATIAITGNYFASIQGFLANLARHSEHSANTPPHLTGLVHILNFIFPNLNVSLNESIASFAALLIAVLIFHFSVLNSAPAARNPIKTAATLALFVASSFFIVPFHYYDMVALVILLSIMVALPIAGRPLIALGLAICFRPDYLLHIIGVAGPGEIELSNIVSSGLLLLALGAAWSLLDLRTQFEPHSERSHSRTELP